MSDYDDMKPEQISREVAQRRQDDGLDRLSDGEWHWPDCPSGIKSRSWSPQPYASELWACASLVEELDEADEFNGMAIVPRPEGGFGASVNGNDGGEIYMRGDTRPEAISRLWLQVDDEGLFDEGGKENGREYTDEELVSAINNALWCEREGCSDFPGSTIDRLKKARDRLRERSGASDKIDELQKIRDALDCTPFDSSPDSERHPAMAVRHLLTSYQRSRDKIDELQEEFDLFREWLESEKLDTGDRIKRNPFATEKGLSQEQGRHKMCCKILEKLDEIKGE